MKTRRIRIGPQGARRAGVHNRGGALMLCRLVAGLCVAFGLAAALGAAWLIWQAPHCRPVAARAYYTPLAAAQCGRDMPRSSP